MNKHIYAIQKEHLGVTPFKKDLGPMHKKIVTGKKFRQKVLRQFYKDVYHANDTVIIKEVYGKMQLGYNKAINIAYRDSNYFYTKSYDTKHGKLIFQKDYIYRSDAARAFDIQRILKDSIRHEYWNMEPNHYGTDCWDADPVFITVLYPAGNIECLYVRCWYTPDQLNSRQNMINGK